jgi:hypothetical protein
MSKLIGIKVVSTFPGLLKILRDQDVRLSRKLTGACVECSDLLKREIASFAPERTGDLKSRILSLPVMKSADFNTRGIMTGVITSRTIGTIIQINRRTDRKILWVNEGTGLYGPFHQFIVPTRSMYMVFEIDGVTFFRRKVRGQKGQKFIQKGVQSAKSKIVRLIRERIKE